MIEISTIVYALIGLAFAAVLFYIMLLLAEVRKILISFRHIAERIDAFTDVKGWINFAQVFLKKRKQKFDQFNK